jgi:hypothetical protein
MDYEELIELYKDSDGINVIKDKVDALVVEVQEVVYNNLLRNFSPAELRMIESMYGAGFVYRMMPDVMDILEQPYDGSTIH